MEDLRQRNERIGLIDEESIIMARIQKYSAKVETVLEEIERLIKQGYSINSTEVKNLQQKLHQIELKSNFWRGRLLRYL